MNEDFEIALAREGDTQSEDHQIAWEEKLALAPSLEAKKALIHGVFGVTARDFKYRSALCTLLEVQELLDENTQVANAKAAGLLRSKEEELDESVKELGYAGLSKKAKRISHRRRLLELELATRMNESQDNVKTKSRALAIEMGLTLSDSAPVDVAEEKPADSSTKIKDDATSAQVRVTDALRYIALFDDKHAVRRHTQSKLETMDVFARELFFENVLSSNSPSKASKLLKRLFSKSSDVAAVIPTLSSDQRGWILDMFLDEYAFEYAEVDGYLDLIGEDMEKKRRDGETFGFRQVHQKLAITHLESLLQRDSALSKTFSNDEAFALRYAVLMRSAIREEASTELFDHDIIKLKVAQSDRVLAALGSFTKRANTIRGTILLDQVRDLLYSGDIETLKQKFFQYIAIPKFGRHYTDRSFFSSVSADELIAFVDALYHEGASPSVSLRVDHVSRLLCDKPLRSLDDEALIKATMYELWAGGHMSDSDEKTLHKHLSTTFIAEQKAECMVVSGRGDLAVWKPKLPRGGAELADWSSKTEISFCSSNPTQFGPDDELTVYVRTRNVKVLSVQVYEVRTVDYYSRNRAEIQGDIKLDGLLPNEEQQIDLSHLAPWQKARVPVKLAPSSMGRRGVFVVEVFEKDTTCRAILRKGHLRHVEKVTARGHEITVLDEQGAVVPDASLTLMNLKAGASRAQSPRTYEPVDATSGVIVVPFRESGESSDKFAVILRHGQFGSLVRPFNYVEAAYTMDAQLYIDNEQLRPGEEAKLLVRPMLTVGSDSTHVSVDLLTEMKASIRFTSVNKESSAGVSQTTVLSLSPSDPVCTFTIPLDAEALSVEVSARVKDASSAPSSTETIAARGRPLPLVKSSKSFTVQRVTQFEATYTPLFSRRRVGNSTRFEYIISVLGHNGEPIAGKEMDVRLSGLHFNDGSSHRLQSDEKGEINLGELEFVTHVHASFASSYPGGNSWSWEMPNLRTHTPQMINCALSESVRVPLPFAYSTYMEEWLAAGMVSVCRVYNLAAGEDPVIEDVTSKSRFQLQKNSSGDVVSACFAPYQIGKFVLYIRPLDVKYPVTVCRRLKSSPTSPPSSNQLLFDHKKILVATQTRPMMILGCNLEVEDERTYLNVQTDGAHSKNTQVWVVAKRFLDLQGHKMNQVVSTNGSTDRYLFMGQLAFEESSLENEFLKKRKISDEYTYILQRRAFIKSNPDSLRLLGGSSLPKPTFIQTPHVVDSSDMEELVMREGEKVSGFKTAEQRERESAKGQIATKKSRFIPKPVGGGGLYGCSPQVVRNASSIGFLAGVSAASSCGPVSADGIAKLCLSDHPVFANAFSGSLELVIVAFDLEIGNVTSLETQITPNGSTMKRDTRLSADEALENATPSMQIQRHQVLKAGESCTLARTFSSKYALYESLSGAMDLWATLCSESSLPELVEKLKRWPEMKKEEKAAFYLKNASDDLNFFLYRKDATFFGKFVKPLLQAKLSKSLIDLYVLEECSAINARYLSPGMLDKLSLIEKLLVAERAGSPEVARAVCQHVIDSIDGECHSNSALGHQLARVFDTVLSQGAVKPQEPVVRDEDLTALYNAVEEEEEGAAFAYSDTSADLCGAQQMRESMMSFASVRSAPMAMRSYSRSSAPPPPAPGAFGFGSAAPEMARMSMPSSAAPRGRMMKKSMPTASRSQARASFIDDDDDEASDSESDGDADDAFSESSDDYGVQSLDDDSGDNEDEDDNASDSKELEDLAKQQRKRVAVKRRAQPYILPGKVRHIQEKRFFTEQKPHLDGCNMFWHDYAMHLMQHSGSVERVPFISSHFPEALRSFTEGVLALSVLDLAYGDVTSTPVRQIAGGLRVRLDPENSVVLYHQGIGAGAVTKEPNSVLILKQRLLLESERTGGDFVDLRPAREFVVNRIYACVVSVSNIGSKRVTNLSLLRQIPRGAIPVTSTGFYTKSEQVEIAPHSTKSFVVNFYFPEPGQFTQYPAHASLDGEVVAWASMDTQYTDPIVVVAKSTAVDLTSWNDVAARGSLSDVLTFMANAKSVRSLSLDTLSWRCSDRSFYEGLIACLRRRYVFFERIWKYAFVHGDIVGMRELCASKSTFTCALGSGVRTSIVTVNDLFRYERFERSVNFDHTEFGPLLTRRVHRVAGRAESSSMYGRGTEVSAGSSADDEPARVLNKKTREFYRTLCHVLNQRSRATSEQLLVMAYFLILFHRVADALVVFDRAKALRATEHRDASTDELSIAVDYMDAYLDFFRPQPATNGSQPFAVARKLAAKHLETMSDRWRERFVRVQEVLDEHDDLHAQRSPAQTSTTTKASSAQREHVPDDEEVRLEAEVKGDEIHFKSQHLGACEISFYRIDVELMFSSEPFDSFSDSAASRSSLLLIEPWKVIQFPLSADMSMDEGAGIGPTMSNSVFKLPPELASSPMMIRIREVVASRTVETVASPIDLTRSYFNSQLQVIVSKQAGTVQVLHDGLPVPASYIKVYAKTSGATKKTQFYKDGYTDVIGKFDYAAINGDLLSRVEKFSVLVSHPTMGTSVVQTAPPVLAVTSSEFKDREAREALWF